MDFDGAREKVKGLNGFSETSHLLFLDGELRLAGSMFSLSKSSNVEGSNALLVGEKTLFDMPMLALPVDVDFCASMPICHGEHWDTLRHALPGAGIPF